MVVAMVVAMIMAMVVAYQSKGRMLLSPQCEEKLRANPASPHSP